MLIARRLLCGWMFATAAALCLAAQTAAPVTVTPRYTPGASYTYDLQIDSHIVRSGMAPSQPAELLNTSRVLMHVLPAPGQASSNQIELSFLKYQTTVRADATLQDSLQKDSAAADAAALHMTPVRVQLQPGGSTRIIARPKGAAYDQPVAVLEQFARTDMLPLGAVKVGDHWSRERVQDIPTMHFSLPLKMECQLTGAPVLEGQPAATISVQLRGSSTLPGNALPNAQQLAAAGFVAQGTIAINGTSQNQYRDKDGVLLSSTSQNHTVLHIQLVGATAEPKTLDTTIDSTGTVTLVPGKS